VPTLDPEKLTQLRSYYGDEFLSELAVLYLEASRRLVDGLNEGLLKGDLEQVIRCAHDLKSTSAQLGAMDLSEAARELEELARGPAELQDLQERGQAFATLYSEAVTAVRAL
jgi:HPt (histidine-containing phosphotransfer) domain-containing protein